MMSALQSPIEYQRRESKSNSLGRSVGPPLSAATGLRPRSSASIDRHRLPALQPNNTSLPTLYLGSLDHSLDHSRSSETRSQREVSAHLLPACTTSSLRDVW